MATELVGGAFLSSLFQTLFERITSPEVVDFFKGKKLNDRLLKKMKLMLLQVNHVLNDAEMKQIIDPSVKCWLEELKEIVYDANELLDEIDTEVLRCKIEDKFSSTSKRLKLSSTSWISTFVKTIEHKIEDIIEKLKFIEEEKDILGLKGGVQNRLLQRLPAALVEESIIYGRDDDKEEIIKMLNLNEDNKISVIPIVGMGGIGKTTLAQLVYDDRRVKEHFEIKAWITVSDEFDIFRITKVIFESVTSSKSNTEDLYQLQVKLKQTLMRKKFLFVLDDVWNENYVLWDALKSPFESGARGSRIILTTRSEVVASKMGNGQIYKLQGVSDEDSWRLFEKHAFYDLSSHSKLRLIGREIVKKCKGLPLAVKSLAGLLRSVLNPEEWRRILKSDIWELQLQENATNNILPALWLSYYYLPPNLKRCFAYCSIFPKDYVFEKERMILLWMAQGFLQPEKGKRMEDVGDEYFQDLISRSLFQRVSQDESTVIMHDLVHDLAVFVSGEFCIRLEGDNWHEIPHKVRHLSYIRMQYNGASKFDAFYGATSLQTFLPLKFSSSEHLLTEKVLSDLLPRLRSLRMLSLSHYSNVKSLPDSIGNLKHLRYLDLSHTGIKVLPATIGTLYNLQTLLLSNCAYLTRLPPEIGRLVKLRHLYIGGTCLKEMPEQMSGLKDLQTLTMFVLGKGKGSNIEELKHFQNLRGKLYVLGLQNVCCVDVSKAKFKDKKHLGELVLKWDTDSTVDSPTALEVLDQVRPPMNLKKLTIENYGGKAFPQWLGDCSLCHLGSLTLTNCKNWEFLPPLGVLPSLMELSIIGFDLVKKLDEDFYGRNSSARPFGSLEVLKFEDMANWEEWAFDIGENESASFPCLRELSIVNCPNFTGCLPEHLPALTELVILKCPKLVAELPDTPALCQLDLINCDKMVLKDIPPKLHWLTIRGCSTTESLFEEMDCSNTSLKEMNISECPSLRFLFRGCPPQTLKALGITDCMKLDLSIRYSYSFLESLSICRSCDSLTFIPLHLFPKLNRLHIENCRYLESLSFSGESHLGITPLKSLQISKCPKFISFPEKGLRNLEWFWVEECENLESLPQEMDSLESLEVLYISHCPELSFPKKGLPSNLCSLSIFSCEKLIADQSFWDLERLSSLESFSISSDCKDLKSFPEEGLLPPSLVSLDISGICNLQSLDYKVLQHLSSLKELKIRNCPKLQSIPDEGLPPSLDSILISKCPLLTKKFQGKYGQRWSRIARNTCIKVDNEVILCDQV